MWRVTVRAFWIKTAVYCTFLFVHLVFVHRRSNCQNITSHFRKVLHIPPKNVRIKFAQAFLVSVWHFEMPYTNQKRLSKFYSNVFGWDMQYLPKMGSYVLAITSPVDKNQMHKKKGAINGGFYPKGPYGNTPHLVISVGNLEKHIETVKKEGGKTVGKSMDITGIGKFIMLRDTEGNRAGMLQAPLT